MPITLKDLVGKFTLIEVPQSALTLLKAKVKYVNALRKYRKALNRMPKAPNARLDWLQNYKRTMAAFDAQKQAGLEYEKEKNKFKSSFGINR